MLAETRARTQALLEESRRLRLQSAQRRRESQELRTACQVAAQACRSSIERCNALPRSVMSSGNLHLGHLITSALSRSGLPAFLVEPSRDTASRS